MYLLSRGEEGRKRKLAPRDKKERKRQSWMQQALVERPFDQTTHKE